MPNWYKAFPNAVVAMHPDDAKARGGQQGMEVLVRSRRGEINVLVETRYVFIRRGGLHSAVRCRASG